VPEATIVFGFFFVTVSSRIVGIIGTSSNPISGMTIATLMATCAMFLVAHWTASAYAVLALTIGGVVCIAAAMAGATSMLAGSILYLIGMDFLRGSLSWNGYSQIINMMERAADYGVQQIQSPRGPAVSWINDFGNTTNGELDPAHAPSTPYCPALWS
jgi:hypothetical protein